MTSPMDLSNPRAVIDAILSQTMLGVCDQAQEKKTKPSSKPSKKRKAPELPADFNPRRSARTKKPVQRLANYGGLVDSDTVDEYNLSDSDEDDEDSKKKGKGKKPQAKKPKTSDSDELDEKHDSPPKSDKDKKEAKEKKEKKENKRSFSNKKKAIKQSILPLYNIKDLKPGDLVSRTIYARVDEVRLPPFVNRPTLDVTHLRTDGPYNNQDAKWKYECEGKMQICSASEYSTTEAVSRTEMLQRFAQCGGDIFTVKFYPRDDKPEDKLAHAKALLKEAEDADEKDRQSDSFIKALLEKVDEKVKKPRVLIGRLVKATPDPVANTLVDDLEVPTDDRKMAYRNVNNRTIFELITRGVRYVLKNPRS